MLTKSLTTMSSPCPPSPPFVGVTPTVVSNFNLPNSNINRDGPYLRILEQPQNKFRFRYKSEMAGTHGQLKAEAATKNKNVFPTVKLCNWSGGAALVRLTLFTAEENANERRRHVHELNGKNCSVAADPRGAGGCEVVVDETNDYHAIFPNLGIVHIAKREVQNIIFNRKKDELIANYALLNKDSLTQEKIQHNITPIQLQKLKSEAGEEAKAMDLNRVALRFEAFCFEPDADAYRSVAERVDSEVIFNLKNASTGELKIIRISAASSPCTGGAEVWMLVEKVKKNNVRIKLFELDQDNREVWKGYGDFKESDVHHQYAIVFRTPPYRDGRLREAVHVKLQLERTTDNDTSEPIDFTYVPQNLKRQSDALTASDLPPMEDSPWLKRARPNHAIDLTKRHIFLGSTDVRQFAGEMPNKSPPHMVPSPLTPAASPASGMTSCFYSPPHHTFSPPPSGLSDTSFGSAVSTNDEANPHLTMNEDRVTIHYENSSQQNGPIGTHCYNGQIIPGATQVHLENPDLSPYPYQQQHHLSPYHQVPTSPSSSGQMSPYGQGVSPMSQVSPMSPEMLQCVNANGYDPNAMLECSPAVENNPDLVPLQESATAQIEQFDAVQKLVIRSKNDATYIDQHSYNAFNFEDDLLALISDPTNFATSRTAGTIQADCAKSRAQATQRTTQESKAGADELRSLAARMAKVSVADRDEEDVSKTATLDDALRRSALTASECLKAFASTGNHKLLKAAQPFLWRTQGDSKNRPGKLHTAVLQKGQQDEMRQSANADLGDDATVRDGNDAVDDDGQTPLHVAARSGAVSLARALVRADSDLGAVDDRGDTPLHVAARQGKAEVLKVLLHEPKNKERHLELINAYNYEGKTPLHLCVLAGCLSGVSLLVRCCASPHQCDRTRGANPLHLAALCGHLDIAKFLIENTSITVDARLLDGTTALSIAGQRRDDHMRAILLDAKATEEDTKGEEETSDEDEGTLQPR